MQLNVIYLKVIGCDVLAKYQTEKSVGYLTVKKTTHRDGSSPKILGGGGIAPISPFITESIFSVLRNRKNTHFSLHIGLHLKSIIIDSTAISVMS